MVSVPEKTKISAKVYPNPMNNFFTIETESQSLKADITSVDGKLIASGLQLSQSSRIDASIWKEGLYFVKLYDENGNFKVLRIIKN